LRALLDLLARMQNDQTVELGADAVSQLLGANGECVTPLYEAAVHSTDSLTDSSAKCERLLMVEAPLFQQEMCLWRVLDEASDHPPSVVITAPARECLRRWLGLTVSNRSTDARDAILALCLDWIGCVDLSLAHQGHRQRHHQRHQMLANELLIVVVYSGFAGDVVPLLLELPLRMDKALALTESLERFLDRQPGDQVLLPRRLLSDLTEELASEESS
jgi:hypothetical protein